MNVYKIVDLDYEIFVTDHSFLMHDRMDRELGTWVFLGG